MHNIFDNKASGPVVAAGLGGSGTRVVSDLLTQAGFYLGHDLNPAGDNLWFTILFKHPHWLPPHSPPNHEEIEAAFGLFEKLMIGKTGLDRSQLEYYFKAVHRYYLQSPRELPQNVLSMVNDRMKCVKKPCPMDLSRVIGWGWKEPNSFIYLPYLHRYFTRMKFIFVIRHGLDMAFVHRGQYRVWSRFFQLDRQDGWDRFPVPRKKLDFWLAANRYALEHGKRLLGDRFLVVDFDTLCQEPKDTVDRLVDFMELPRTVDREKLYGIPKAPASRERYKKEDISVFTRWQLDGVRELGYPVTDIEPL